MSTVQFVEIELVGVEVQVLSDSSEGKEKNTKQ